MLRRFCAFVALLAISLFAPVAAHAAVTHAASASASGTGSASASLTVPAAGNRYLAVGVSTLESATVTSVSFGAQVLTREHASAKDSSRAEVWAIKAPNPGTAEVRVTVTGNAPVVVGASAFIGVDQTLPVIAGNSTDANNASNSAHLWLNDTVEADGMFGVIAVNDAPNITGIRTTGSSDTVEADTRWTGRQSTVLGAGATRRGWTRQNFSLNAGIGFYWNRIDPSHLMPYSFVLTGLRQATTTAPTVGSPIASSITHNAATLSATVVETGGEAVTQRGAVYCQCANPLIGGAGVTRLDAGAGDIGTFEVAAPGLTPSTTYTFRAFATNAKGTVYTASMPFTTAPQPNRAPTADAGGPYAIDEGSELALRASATDADSDPLTYAWDIDGDDDFDDATGATPTLTAAQLRPFGLDDGPKTASVRVRVSDGKVTTTSPAATVTVRNVAPTANVSGGRQLDEGERAQVRVVEQADPADTELVYDFDFGDDGTWDITGSSSATADLPAALTADGSTEVRVRARIRDKDGGSSTYLTGFGVRNVAPTAKVADVTVDEGSAATLRVTDLADVTADLPGIRYAYDLENNGTFEITDSTSAEVAVPAALTSDGPDTHTVRVRVGDKDGGTRTYTARIIVRGVAPTATVPDVAIDEGAVAQVRVTDVADVSPVDTFAGVRFRYDFDADGTWDVGGTTFLGSVTASTATVPAALTADGAKDVTVRVGVIDKNDIARDYTAAIKVRNVAPTATLTGATVDEGQSATVTFSDADDVAADKAAGFSYEYDLDGDGTFEVKGAEPTATLKVTDGPATLPVKGAILDKDGGRREYDTTVVVRNVAPTAKLNGVTVEEGNPATVTFSDQDDVSAPDEATGFSYEYDLDGDGRFELKTGDPTVTVATTNGPSTREITGAIVDKDGGRATYKATVTVENAAPTATLTGDTVDEGSPATITFSDADDAAADKAAGFSYEYDLDGDGVFEVKGTEPTATLKTTDGPATLPVKGAIVDRDGGRREYSTTVQVRNLMPTLTLDGAGTATAGAPYALTATAADADPLTGTVAWGDGTADAYAASVGHVYAAAGTYTVAVTVRDKDGAETTATHVVTVAAAPAPPTATPSPAPGGGVAGVEATNLRISNVRVTPRCIRATGLKAVTSAAKTIKVQFRVSAAADVTFRLTRQDGKGGASKCPPASGVAQKGGRKVPGVYSPFSHRAAQARSGLNTVTLAATGRKGKTLKPGTYLLTITAGDVTARTKVWVLAR